MEIPSRDIPRLNHTIDDEVVSRYFNAVKVRFLVDQLFSLADVHDATMVGLSPNEGAEVPAESVEKRKAEESEEVWDVSDLQRSTKCGLLSLERVKTFCESRALPVRTTAVGVEQLSEDAVCKYADFRTLETSVDQYFEKRTRILKPVHKSCEKI